MLILFHSVLGVLIDRRTHLARFYFNKFVSKPVDFSVPDSPSHYVITPVISLCNCGDAFEVLAATFISVANNPTESSSLPLNFGLPI